MTTSMRPLVMAAACCAAVVLAVPLRVSAVAPPRRPPNFVVILMDDMGWRDVGFMGNTFVETPHLDRLARQGVVFTQSYASAPNCAPTRACLMSGQVTPRHGIYTVVDPRQPPGSPWHKLVAAESESELAPQVVTLPESLGAAGYATGFFGMWNLGRGRQGPVTPGGQGFGTVVFPESIGFAKDAYFDDRGNYLSDRLADEVLAFMESNRDRPFFAYLADHAVHAPFEPRADLRAKYEKKAAADRDGRDDPAYAATIEAVDANVGRMTPTRSTICRAFSPTARGPSRRRCMPGNGRRAPRSPRGPTRPTTRGPSGRAAATVRTAAAGSVVGRSDRMPAVGLDPRAPAGQVPSAASGCRD